MDDANLVKHNLTEMMEDAQQGAQLTQLDLSRCRVDNETDLAVAVTMLTAYPHITSLHLGQNSLGLAGALVLAAKFGNGSLGHIQHLDLSYTNTNSRAAYCILKALKQQANIRSLVLSGNNIGKSGAAMLAEVAEELTNLQVLDVSYVHSFAAFGMDHLNHALKASSSLRWLSIEGNDVGNHGIRCLTTALRKNSSLEVLILDYNGITAAGLESLSNALMCHPMLQRLSIAGMLNCPYI